LLEGVPVSDESIPLLVNHDSDDTLTEREIWELFFAIDPSYRPGIEHWTIGPRAAEMLRALGHLLPAPEIPRNEEFEAWRKRTAGVLKKCAEMKR
jgi:hypothetical protein